MDQFFMSALGMLSFGYFDKPVKKATEDKNIIWERVGKVKNIYSYPLEGGYRQEATKAYCSEYGLQPILPNCDVYFLDRCYFVYDAVTRRCITNTNVPLLVTIKITADSSNETFKLEAPNQPEMVISAFTVSNKTVHMIYHDEEQPVFDCGTTVAKWLSNYLLGASTGLRLAVSNGIYRRKLKIIRKPVVTNEEKLNRSVLEMKADFSGYSLISQASIDEVNSRLEGAILPSESFRLNCVIELNSHFNRPYAEDHFEYVRIGNAEFRDVVLCTVSDFFEVNPETGVKSELGEPVHTLKRLRALKKLSPIFAGVDIPAIGINMEIKKQGTINVDDDIYVKFKH